VRRICVKCRLSKEVDLASKGSIEGISETLIKKYFGENKTIRVYEGRGCDVCHDTGFTGREGIYEVLVVDDAIREAVVKRIDANEIMKIAVSSGMETMLENGIQKVKEGITTLDEVLRVTKE